MTADVLTTLSLLAVTNLCLGWWLGFRAVAAYLIFWMFAGLAGFTALRLVARLFPWSGAADAIIRGGTLAFALIVACGLALGYAGLIGTIPFAIFFAGCFAASLYVKPAGPFWPARLPSAPACLAAVLVPTLAFIVAAGLIHAPLTLYDSVSYHLVFPARWLQEHRLSVVPTPFSDEAQAYAPANGELFFLWLMLPFHGDLVARIGQLPFYLLGGVALYALARHIGAKPAHAIYAPAFFFLARPIVEQAAGADVDLICWTMFLTSLYLGLVAVDSNERRDWMLWGVSLGLYWGSKYVSLVYTPVFLLLPLLRGPRVRTLWALPGILIFAMPWYLRNWVIAGSPIYPSSLTIAGFTVAQGAYSRMAMQHSVFHTTNVRLFPVLLSHAFGTPLFLFWWPFAIAGAWAMAALRPRRHAAFLLIVPVLMVPLYWFGVPDNVDSRFLLPVAMVALLPLAFAFRANRTWNAWVHGLYGLGFFWLLVGRRADLPVALPWYLAGWLSLDGLTPKAFLLPFAGLAALAGGLAFVGSRRSHRAAPAVAAVFAVGCIGLAVGSKTWCAPSDCDPLTLSPTHIRPEMVLGWQWIADHARRATIANTGNNLPYPLFGEQLGNRVYYVNINRHVTWRFHDYDRAYRRHRADDPLPAAPLAVSSGVLMPSGAPGWRVDAVRPRYERMEGNRDAWLQNLRSLGVDYLFVSALSAYEVDYVWHNDGHLPIEDDWARFDPAGFTVVYENPMIKIYSVHLP
jgi:hypothetical protein